MVQRKKIPAKGRDFSWLNMRPIQRLNQLNSSSNCLAIRLAVLDVVG